MSNSTALAVQQVPRMTLPEKLEFCKFFCQSDLLPEVYRNNPANVLLQVEYGEALGIPPVIAIQQVHIIKGKPCSSATLMAGVVLSHGHRLTVEGDDTFARATLQRKDNPFVYTATWTAADTKRAGLDKPSRSGEVSNHVKYPQAMYQARAIAAVCKIGAQDAICGLSLPEEVDSPAVFVGEVRESEPEVRVKDKGKEFTHIQVSAPVKVAQPEPESEKPKRKPRTAPVEAEQAVLVEEPAPEPPVETPELKAARSKVWSLSKSLWAENAEAKFEETMGEHPRVIKVTSIPDCQLWIEKLETLLDEKYINAEFAG